MKLERRDFVIFVLVLFVWAISLHEAYRAGDEHGYWEHEAEENVYACRTFQ